MLWRSFPRPLQAFIVLSGALVVLFVVSFLILLPLGCLSFAAGWTLSWTISAIPSALQFSLDVVLQFILFIALSATIAVAPLVIFAPRQVLQSLLGALRVCRQWMHRSVRDALVFLAQVRNACLRALGLLLWGLLVSVGPFCLKVTLSMGLFQLRRYARYCQSCGWLQYYHETTLPYGDECWFDAHLLEYCSWEDTVDVLTSVWTKVVLDLLTWVLGLWAMDDIRRFWVWNKEMELLERERLETEEVEEVMERERERMESDRERIERKKGLQRGLERMDWEREKIWRRDNQHLFGSYDSD